MMQASSTLFAAAKQGLHELGYTGELIQEDYAFADFGVPEPRVRRIPLAAFGHIPTSFESAWIGVTVGSEDAQSLRRFHALGAPQILVLNEDSVGRWKMPAMGEPVFQERFPAGRLLEVIRERRSAWGREVVARAKSISFSAEPLQLDFYDAGLVPTIEAIVRKKLDRLLSEALARALKTYQEHVPGDPDLPGLYRLVFRLLAAKLLEDRGHPGDWAEGDASEVVSRVERYYYGSRPIPPAVTHPEVQRAAWRYMQNGFHLQNVSVRTLAYIYENTLVSSEARKQHSIHGTPPEIADYVVRRLPFEKLDRNDRRVFEPFAGHAVFLIAALGRLRELLEPGLSDRDRHDYFVRMLAGMEEEPFAIEVARLSLMLADYPNPDGWQLEQRDIFAAHDVAERLAAARVVLCNPPFEDFSGPNRARYRGLRSVNQATDILTRVLDRPPALLGFVLPRVFRDGQSFREARKRLVEQYGAVEITELPDRAFAHSDVRAILLLAHGPSQGQVELRCSTVKRQDFGYFLATGEPSSTSATRLPTSEAAKMAVLWRFPLERVWENLKDHPQLETVAAVHRGIEYRVPLGEHRKKLVTDRPRRGFALGLVNVEDDFEPFRAEARDYLNTSPRLVRRGGYLADMWEKPKAIANARRHSRGPWRLAAVPDRRGLVIYQNFIGVWPTGDWTIEVLAAVLSGYVANAFADLREERDNRVQTIRAVPLPRLARQDRATINGLVREYERRREDLARGPSRELASRCRQLLAEIDSAILRAYALPQNVEAELVQHFARRPRPGAPSYSGEDEPPFGVSVQLPLGLAAVDGASADRVVVIDRPGVSRLLREQPELATVVNEAVDQLVNLIPDARLNLELLIDPDYGDGEQLLLGVSTGLQDGEALEALRRFDQEWWVHHVRRARGLLCIDLSDE